ncbi:hypothetical protein SELMODRAFT_431382 [Selaginella moellendorffii]|uniref:Neprosin domain-containing protein n=1 Tax=Selaginella moellendorffii TaxID=88036 RepID=D8TCF0_SELML|nr:uncharacterized protein LOC9640816 [Selaginella moellendorffii]XP_002994214.1 uncharacterized protein LOC9638317 [Selaginella moellendorffii]EFJ04719.1 hypothetical protein SELMODRAFT_432151 [Selaginella moellendorffii]EFJ05678.1 hypothetical protein SELMODRAFT_431382 [Selaginella moellendorffii]|eukprot:XP_002993257.1 uncharacterized protein LOC9640816 [Selaginella moellendorffii]
MERSNATPLFLLVLVALSSLAQAEYKLGIPLQKYSHSSSQYEKPAAYKQVAIEGFVYCHGSQRKPLEGAAVGAVSSESNRYVGAKTNSYGYFYIPLNYDRPKKPVNPKSWRVFLVSSPDQTCSVKTNTGNGKTGAFLARSKSFSDRILYTVGPFEFMPLPPGYTQSPNY